MNVTVILDLNWPSTTFGTDVETTFMHYLNVSLQRWAPTSTQCGLNVFLTSFPNVGERHCPNIHKMLPEHCLNIGQNWPMLWQCCANVGNLVKIQHWYNVHTTLSGHQPNVAGMFKSFYIWTLRQRTLGPTLRQRWHQSCDNVATMLEH